MNRRSIAQVCRIALAVSPSALASHAQSSRNRGQGRKMEAIADKCGARVDMKGTPRMLAQGAEYGCPRLMFPLTRLL